MNTTAARLREIAESLRELRDSVINRSLRGQSNVPGMRRQQDAVCAANAVLAKFDADSTISTKGLSAEVVERAAGALYLECLDPTDECQTVEALKTYYPDAWSEMLKEMRIALDATGMQDEIERLREVLQDFIDYGYRREAAIAAIATTELVK